MQLTAEQETGYNLIELRVIIQRGIEILDDLDLKKNPMANKPLKTMLKGIYAPLDKQTKLYNEIFEASPEGAMHFYNVVKNNADFIMQNHLLDKALICSFLMAHQKNPKAVEGIMEKILK